MALRYSEQGSLTSVVSREKSTAPKNTLPRATKRGRCSRRKFLREKHVKKLQVIELSFNKFADRQIQALQQHFLFDFSLWRLLHLKLTAGTQNPQSAAPKGLKN